MCGRDIAAHHKRSIERRGNVQENVATREDLCVVVVDLSRVRECVVGKLNCRRKRTCTRKHSIAPKRSMLTLRNQLERKLSSGLAIACSVRARQHEAQGHNDQIRRGRVVALNHTGSSDG